MALTKKNLVDIKVINADGELLTDAKIIIKAVLGKTFLDEGVAKPKLVTKRFKMIDGLLETDFLLKEPFEEYDVTVSMRGYDNQTRRVQLGADCRIEETFIMGTGKSLYTYVGNIKVPFEGDVTEKGFKLADNANPEEVDQLINDLEKLGLTVEEGEISGFYKTSFAKKKDASKRNIKKLDSLLFGRIG